MAIYTLITALNEYDPNVYGDNAALKMPIVDGKNFGYAMAQNNHQAVQINNTTRADARGVFNAFAAKVKAGDTLYWFHSGHGTMRDTAAGRMTGRCFYDGVLWDYEVATMLQQLPEGVTCVTISDTCYAESNSRNAAPEDTYFRAKMVRATTEPPAMVKQTIKTSKYKAAIIHMSASTITEVAYETQKGGIYTYALLNVLSKTPDISIGKMETAVRAWIKKNSRFKQTPVVWCNAAGKAKKPQPFIPVLSAAF